jgi:transposase-like protein
VISDLLQNTDVSPRRRGRPRIGTTPRQTTAIEAVSRGRSVEDVAKELGVHYSTVYDWIRSYYG